MRIDFDLLVLIFPPAVYKILSHFDELSVMKLKNMSLNKIQDARTGI
jgi:hypothetical protein